MVNNNIILEYNSSDKFNLIQKNTQGGLYLSSNRIVTSKASHDDIIFNLTGIIIVSPKEVNFNYDVEKVKLVIVFIHKNDTNQLLLIHLPVLITENSKPTIELSNFFKSIVNKSNLIQKKNKLHVDELLLNNISFGNKRPEIKVFNNNSKIHNYFKHEIFHKIKNYTSVISAIVSTNNNLITNDLFNKLHKLTNSSFYPKLFTNSTKKNSFNILLNNFGLKHNKIVETFTSLREGLTPQDAVVQKDIQDMNTIIREPAPGFYGSNIKKAEIAGIQKKMLKDEAAARVADAAAAKKAAAAKAAAAKKAAAQKAAAAKAAAAKKAASDPSTYLNKFKKQAEDEAASVKAGATKDMDNLSKDAKYSNNPIQNINSDPTDKNGNSQDHIYMECRPTTTSNDSVINLIHRPSFSGLGSSLSGLGHELGGDLSGLGHRLGLGGGSGSGPGGSSGGGSGSGPGGGSGSGPGGGSGSGPGGGSGSGPGGGSGGGPGGGSGAGSGHGGLGNKLGNELGSSYNSLSHLLGSIVDFLANCDIEYAIIGFGVTLLILYLIHKLYQKAFSSKGEAANTLLDLSLIKAQAEPI
jgi:hypothetical protein